MAVLGIIPARSGSQRVKDKNIRPLNGKPLIQYTIEAASAAELIDYTLVSTDSDEYANLCKSLGANVPFIRPSDLAQSSTGDLPVLLHAIEWYEQKHSVQVKHIVLLRPTSPFKTGKMIDQAIELILENTNDCVRSMTKVGGVHHPYWMYRKSENGDLAPFDQENTTDKFYQSQLLPPIYRLNGVVDVYDVEAVKSKNTLSFSNMGMLELDDIQSMDIDTEFDFKVCEAMMKEIC